MKNVKKKHPMWQKKEKNKLLLEKLYINRKKTNEILVHKEIGFGSLCFTLKSSESIVTPEFLFIRPYRAEYVIDLALLRNACM